LARQSAAEERAAHRLNTTALQRAPLEYSGKYCEETT